MDAYTLTIRRLCTSARTPTHNWFNSSTRKLSHSIHLGDARSSQTQATHGWVCRNDLPNDVHIKFDPPPGAVAAAKQQCRRARLAQHKLVLPGKEELAIKIYALSHLKTHHSPNTGHCMYSHLFNMYNIFYTRYTNRHTHVYELANSGNGNGNSGHRHCKVCAVPVCCRFVSVCVLVGLLRCLPQGRQGANGCKIARSDFNVSSIFRPGFVQVVSACVSVAVFVCLYVCAAKRVRACVLLSGDVVANVREYGERRASMMRIVYVMWALLVWLSAFEVSAYVNLCVCL